MSSNRTRLTGPIAYQTTLKQRKEVIGRSEWISIDVTDGSWTEHDPNSTLVSKSVAAGGMTISLESDRDSDDWTTGAQDCVRWFKPLTTPAGNLMKWEDEFGVEFLVQRMSTTANDENFLVACIGDDPTDSTNQKWAGGKMVNDTNGDIQLRVGGDQDLNLGTGDTSDIGSTPKCYINCMLQIADNRSSDAIEPIGVAGIVLNSDSDALTNMLMNGQNIAWNNSNNVYLIIAAGWEASGASSDSSAVWKVWYRLTHSFAKMNPQYVPGGGRNPRGGVPGTSR